MDETLSCQTKVGRPSYPPWAIAVREPLGATLAFRSNEYKACSSLCINSIPTLTMTIPEIVARPADAVQRLFVKAGCPLSGDGDFGVTEHFQDAIKNCGLEQVSFQSATQSWKAFSPWRLLTQIERCYFPCQIPFLQSTNAERLPHHSLVRFYGMVRHFGARMPCLAKSPA